MARVPSDWRDFYYSGRWKGGSKWVDLGSIWTYLIRINLIWKVHERLLSGIIPHGLQVLFFTQKVDFNQTNVLIISSFLNYSPCSPVSPLVGGDGSLPLAARRSLGKFLLHSCAATFPQVSFDWQMYEQICKSSSQRGVGQSPP